MRVLTEDKLLRKAEKKAKRALCRYNCLCPKLKKMELCEDCEVFHAVRQYYMNIILKNLPKENDYAKQ